MPPLVLCPCAPSPAKIVGLFEPLSAKLIDTDIVSSGVGSRTTLSPREVVPPGLTERESLAIARNGNTPTMVDALSIFPTTSVNDASTFKRPPSSASVGVYVLVLLPTVDQVDPPSWETCHA